MKTPRSLIVLAAAVWSTGFTLAQPATAPLIVEAESGTFSGWIDRHSCWHNVMLTDEPHSTHSGTGLVDTPNKTGSFIEVAYDAPRAGPHRVTVRYTHIKPDPRPGQLWINGKDGPILPMPQGRVLPAFRTDSAVVTLPQGRNLIRLVALADGGLGNVDYLKVTELREPDPGEVPRVVVLEAEDGLFEGKVDHHSCWNFIAQHPGPHTGFTGEGYVDADNKIGSHFEVTFDVPAAGCYVLAARYAHGKPDTRVAELRVNGEVTEAEFAFPPTRFWTDWVYVTSSRPVELKAGKNTVRLTAATAEGLANLDHLKFTPAPTSTAPVRLSEVTWGGVGCYKIETPMGTVYFEKDNGISGFKSFVDRAGNDWIAAYMPPGPNGDFRGFPNSVGNFGHAGRNSGSTTKVIDGRTEGDHVILESSNVDFTFQYWFFPDRIAVKVLRSKGDYCFLLETVAGGTADAADYFAGADGVKRIPRGEFPDFSPEWFYIGDPKAKQVLFLAKTPDDNAPNENHRQIRPNGMHNMDLYSFGRAGREQNYEIRGMSGNEHICVIGFLEASLPHAEIAARMTRYLADPFALPPAAPAPWNSSYLRRPPEWYATPAARAVADSVLQYQSSKGGWPKSTNLAVPPRTPDDIPPEGRGRANSLDNDATTVPMRFLALVATATDEPRYRESFLRGVEYLLAAQYPNGGWPQFWPLRGDYYDHITFNDGAMIRVMQVLQGVASGRPPYAFVDEARRTRATTALARGLDCVLKTQISQDGKLTGWCAQHDEKTLDPTWARKYEPPSIAGAESVTVAQFLMSVEKPSPEIVAAIEGVVAWLRAVPIAGQRLDEIAGADGRNERRLTPDPKAPLLWARFYELGTNRPVYLDRDSVFRYDFMQVGYERRSGYDYHGTWAAPLLENDYPAWRARLAKTPN